MKDVIKSMIATIIDAEEKDTNQFVIEDMVVNLKQLLNIFEETINCPSNWRDLREELQEEFEADQFILDILSEY